MKSNRTFMKILIVFLVFTMANFSPCVYAESTYIVEDSPPSVADGVETIINTITTIVESIIVRLTLNLGDGLLFFISKSVGEVVTIDAIVYNSVDKLNINYWDGAATGIRGIFKETINKWYKVFYKIAIIAYMIVLVFAGIQILLHSTAEKTAKYKEYLVSWVMRSCNIMSFPICNEIHS